jgi:hypothetical protein
MKVVYVAGPFNGPTSWDVAENVRNAERAGLEVAHAGAMPLIPHANTHLFHGQLTLEFWYEGTLELLRRCDGLFLVEGWHRSKGSKEEFIEAVRRRMPIFRSPLTLRNAVQGEWEFGAGGDVGVLLGDVAQVDSAFSARVQMALDGESERLVGASRNG